MLLGMRDAKSLFVAVMISFSGCALDDPPKYPQRFDPENLLHQDLRGTESPTHEVIILPDDLISRPEVKEIVTKYMAFKQTGSDVEALTFINEAIERGEGLFSSHDIADLQLIRATALYGRAGFSEAESSCDRAIELDSANWRAFHFRAMLREKRGADQGFRDDLRRASELRKGRTIPPFSTTGYVI
jgi:Flp pilus assembly protein TadD